MAPKSNRNQIVKTGHNNSAGARDFPTVNKCTPGMQYLRRGSRLHSFGCGVIPFQTPKTKRRQDSLPSYGDANSTTKILLSGCAVL